MGLIRLFLLRLFLYNGLIRLFLIRLLRALLQGSYGPYKALKGFVRPLTAL